MNNNKINERKINLGLQLLRMILSFWIVIIHSYFFKGKKKLKKHFDEKMFHVPTFMLISYYFFYNHLYKKDNFKIIQRFKRLLIPYIIWPFIYLVINNSVRKLFSIKNENIDLNLKRPIYIKDYFFQIVLSSRYYPPFWYINVLLFLSIIFTIIAYIFKNQFLFIIQLFGFFSYVLHYSDIYDFLRKNKLFELCIVLIIQLIPVAVIGLTFGSVNLINLLSKCQLRVAIMSFLFLICLFKFEIFKSHDGFLYQKVELNSLGAIDLFIFFSSLPFDKIKNTKVINFIKLISNNTGGIYYIHNFVRGYLVRYIRPIKEGSFLGSTILYIISHLICFIGSKIFRKNILRFLFI